MCVLVYLFTEIMSNPLLYTRIPLCGSSCFGAYVHMCKNALNMQLCASVGTELFVCTKEKLQQLVSQTERISGEENTAVFFFSLKVVAIAAQSTISYEIIT